MTGMLMIAWRFTRASWGRNALVAVALGLAMGLPIAASRALSAVQGSLLARAQATPLVAGPWGSSLDLVLRATQFNGGQGAPPSIKARDLLALGDDAAAQVMPLVLGAHVRGVPVVGATLEYGTFRALRVQQGRAAALLGEAMLGDAAARRLGATVGDSIVTSPDQVYSVAGSYPARLQVVGVLAHAGAPEDDAVLVGLETAWAIAGIGHVHQALDGNAPLEALLRKEDGHVAANATVQPSVDLRPQSGQTFHFHGDPGDFPVNAAVVVPSGDKQAAILLGRADKAGLQVVRPYEVLEELFVRVFRMRDLLAGVFVVVLAAAVLLVATQMALLVRMRAPQRALLRRVGASEGFLAGALLAEGAMVAVAAVAVAAVIALASPLAEPLVRAAVAP